MAGKVSEVLELLDGLRTTLRAAQAKARLVEDTARREGHEQVTTDAAWIAGALTSHIDAADLAYYRLCDQVQLRSDPFSKELGRE